MKDQEFPKEYFFDLKSIQGSPSYPRTGHFAVTYRGINYIKCPFDYVVYQMLIEEVRPDLVIEIGTHSGGGALYLSDIVSRWGGVVHSIDIQNETVQSDLVIQNPGICLFYEGYQNYDLNLAKGFKNVMVIDDGSHYYTDVIKAFEKFQHLVPINSYYVIEDGIIYFEDSSAYEGGPLRALEEILSNSSEFEIDRRWTDLFGLNSTFNTNGYLKRIHSNLLSSVQEDLGLERPVFLVSTYIYNEETEKILVNSLTQLNQTGIPILIVSNSPLQTKTLDLVDYFIYLEEAPFFGDHYSEIPLVNFWFGNDSFEVQHWLPSYQRYGLSVLRNLFTGLDVAQSLGFDSFIWMTGDNDFGLQSIEKLKDMRGECSKLGKKALVYLNGPLNVSSVPLFSNIEYFKKIIPCIKKEEDYMNFLMEKQGNLNFMDVERFLGLNLELNADDKILIKDGLTDLFADFQDTKWNLVTAIYTTDPKYSGCVTGPFNFSNAITGDTGKCVFSRNQRNTSVIRHIEVYFEDNTMQKFVHDLGPNFWTYDYFHDFKKIRVFENGELLFEESGETRNLLTLKE